MVLKSKLLINSFLTSVLLLGAQATYAEVIFKENFDEQPDWTSTMHSVSQSQKISWGDILPDNWHEIYQGTQWSPETGYPNKNASIEILASNADKARGRTGKSMVNWRESYSDTKWNSDSQMIHLLAKQHDELYVEFWISFSDNWWQRNNVSH